MLTKNKLKFLRSLQDRKTRWAEKCYLVEGLKAVNELILNKGNIVEIFCTSDYGKQDTFQTNIPVNIISEKELSQISSLNTPQPIIALVKIEDLLFDITAIKQDLVLILDNIQDPGNLGTIIRIADWFGINTIIASKTTVDVYNPKVVQSTMGSISRVKVFYESLEEVLSNYKTNALPIYGALLKGENVYQKSLKKTGAIVLGNESIGISDPLKTFITDPIHIPSFGGGAESLNVAVATGIICSEFRRKEYL